CISTDLAPIHAAISREARKGIVDPPNDQHRDPRKSRELPSLARSLAFFKPLWVGFRTISHASCRPLSTVGGGLPRTRVRRNALLTLLIYQNSTSLSRGRVEPKRGEGDHAGSSPP
ncbi:MAG: hypothetical protein ABGZ24_24435, partial [Fuerstiella sp.]